MIELIKHYTVKLDPRTKKNHQMIAGSGPRCPVCRKPAKQFVKQGKASDEYTSAAVWRLIPRPPKPIDYPVWVKYHFFMQTKRKVDTTNLQSAMDDILVNAGILLDDNKNILVHHDGTRVFYDKENPRTEIYIYRYKEEDDGERENV